MKTRSRAFRHDVLVLVLLAGTIPHAQQPLRDAEREPTRGTAGLAGFVTDAATGQPLRGAELVLTAREQRGTRRTYTDGSGQFVFPELPAGRYTLWGSKPGYVRMNFGAKRHDRPGTAIQVDDGQVITDLRLSLAKGGVITGRLTDETGLPAVGLQVRAYASRVVLGERQIAPVGGAEVLRGETTDDRGVYRLFGLPPGEYVVVASPRLTRNEEIRAMTDAEIRAALQAARQPAGAAPIGARGTAGPSDGPRRDDGPTVGFAPVFYPGTTTAGTASVIAVGAGEERTGVDFQMQLVRTARIEGVVIPTAGIPPQSVSLMLTPLDEPTLPGLGLRLNRATPDADGKFTYRSIAPGRYTLTARAVQGGPGGVREARTTFQMSGGGAAPPVIVSEPGGPQPPAFWAVADVTVAGENIESIVLPLQPAMTLRGRITVEGEATPPDDLSRARLSMQPAPTGGMTLITSGLPSATVAADGSFTISNVTPGRYSIAGSLPTPRESFSLSNWRMSRAMVNGRDVLDFPLEVLPHQDVSDAQVVFTDLTQEVSGSLQDASGRPAPDYTIVVFPSDPGYWLPNARRIRTARPATDGAFVIDGLPPGSYRMAAVVDMAEEDRFDPAFLEQLVAASYEFTLAPGEKRRQDLRISGGGGA